MVTKVAGLIFLLIGLAIIFYMILGGFKIAIDAVEQENKRDLDKKARELASKMYDDTLRNTRINITQRIVIVDETKQNL